MKSIQEDSPTTTSKPTSAPSKLDNKLVLLLAVICGLTVANLYYSQPLLPDIARTFAISQAAVGIIATLTQLGYAVGLLLIVPLGDSHDRRRLTILMLLVVTVALIATALAPTSIWLALASFAVGVTTIAPQIIIPFAASLAPAHERGRVVGTIMSGLLIGVLLARTISGFIGGLFGWRAMYWIAAVMMLALVPLLRAFLPRDEPHDQMNYPQLLRSLWGLIRTEPVLRESSIFGGLVFGAFSVFWVTLAFFLTGSPYHYGSGVVGLFGLVGVAGATAATVVGRLSDRMDARRITGVAMLIALMAFVTFWLAGHWLWGLIVGITLLDLGTQANQISNQARIYGLNPETRSRLNTVYMVTYFIGGSLGSALGAYGWSIARWNGVCAVGALLLLGALALYIRPYIMHRVAQRA